MLPGLQHSGHLEIVSSPVKVKVNAIGTAFIDSCLQVAFKIYLLIIKVDRMIPWLACPAVRARMRVNCFASRHPRLTGTLGCKLVVEE